MNTIKITNAPNAKCNMTKDGFMQRLPTKVWDSPQCQGHSHTRDSDTRNQTHTQLILSSVQDYHHLRSSFARMSYRCSSALKPSGYRVSAQTNVNNHQTLSQRLCLPFPVGCPDFQPDPCSYPAKMEFALITTADSADKTHCIRLN